jgi:hypothetical protein
MTGWLAAEVATEIEQTPLGKLTAWASATDTKMADLAKHVKWGFIIILVVLIFLRK